eukprot:g30844.t1
MTSEAFSKAMASVVGLLAIVVVAMMYWKAIFFLWSEQVVHLSVQNRLTVCGIYLPVDPLEVTAQRVVLPNNLSFIASELLLCHLQSLVETRSGVIPFLFRLRVSALKPVYSFWCEVFICLTWEEVTVGIFV